ncbi:MAG TPA: putative Ig domain-containing protein [Steroidobacteraceae bacterium]|nr:putative Ig domain-containing protein [Steroidobacteraceae bacterium]
MQYLHFGTHRALRNLIALVVGITWCAVSVASAGTESDWWRWRDKVTISGAPAPSVTVGQSYSFTPSATDSRNRTLVFAIANKPAWASFSTSTGQLAGSPASSNVGTYANIVIAASDGRRTATLPAFSIKVLAGSAASPPPTATPPTISGTPPTTDVAGTAYAFQPKASGPSGMTLAFSVQNKPTWANFSIATGMLSGTPTTAQTGTYSNIVLSVSDGVASSSLAPFTITVTPTSPTTGNATVNWVAPTQNTNGTALTNLAGLRIYYGNSPSSLNQMVQVASTSQTSTTISNLASGVWYFGGVAYTNAGTQSAMSGVVSATIP